MKNAEYVKTLREKDAAGLKDELTALRKEQFNLRMQAALGQMNQSHLIHQARKKIARLKTIAQQQVTAQAKKS